jgi:pimeloyl-ACP methyl ester carboxylesterase
MSIEKMTVQSSLLKVPGAQIYYERQGSGPILVMIPGGSADAGIFAGTASLLAADYTVVRYDPRGNSRSVVDGPPQDQDMDVHGDDAAQLLDELGGEPAYALGNSGGAQIGLNLAARYPDRVRTLVAHEPPCLELLPEAEERRAFTDGVYDTYVTEGAGAAMQKFMAGAGISNPRPGATPPPPELLEAFGRMRGNLDYFFGHGFKAIGAYVPDVAALRAGSARIVVGVGEASTGQLPCRAALALAEQLGTAPVSFPGGHGGYNDHPAAFAEKLRQVLSVTPATSNQILNRKIGEF